jgi:DNA-binding MarR family transcriptional regulator
VSNSSSDPPLHIGALLRFALQLLRERIYEGVVAAGFKDVRPAHVTLFRWPGPDGQRPSALATAAGITRQSVNDLLRDLEERGYLTLEPDPADDRARAIRLTARGHRLHKTALAVHERIERDWERTIGAKTFAHLRRGLERVTREVVPARATVPPTTIISRSRKPRRD